MLCRFFLAALLACAAPAAHAWGRLGHEAIGTVAGELLKPKARLAVKKILGNDYLADAGTWLDEVRTSARGMGPLAGDKEAAAFNKKFPDSNKWHFTNLPLGTLAYSDGSRFASPDDAIHTVRACVATLEGRSNKLSPKQALRVLVHVVGDLHQPLHVGTGYFDVRNPDAPKLITAAGSVTDKSEEDLGGNKVQVGHGNFDSLHAYWDTKLVERVASTANADKLAAYLKRNVNLTTWRTAGDYHAWAEQWATETVHEALLVYKGIEFKAAKLSNSKRLETLEAELSKDYEAQQKLRTQTQLAKAGFHLADLLNSLEWKTP
jgi:hypothetical protein